jgi:hypothetical protein
MIRDQQLERDPIETRSVPANLAGRNSALQLTGRMVASTWKRLSDRSVLDGPSVRMAEQKSPLGHSPRSVRASN